MASEPILRKGPHNFFATIQLRSQKQMANWITWKYYRVSVKSACHLADVKFPPLNTPNKVGKYLTQQPQRDEKLRWPRQLVTTMMSYWSKTVTHSSANRAWCRVTSLICTHTSVKLEIHNRYSGEIISPLVSLHTSLIMAPYPATEISTIKMDMHSKAWIAVLPAALKSRWLVSKLCIV